MSRLENEIKGAFEVLVRGLQDSLWANASHLAEGEGYMEAGQWLPDGSRLDIRVTRSFGPETKEVDRGEG